MLVLSRKSRESIRIGDVTVSVSSIRRKSVRLAIDAPRSVKVLRAELQRPHHAAPDPTALEPEARYRVLLIDKGRPEVVYECESRNEANAWVEEWDTEHLGMPAVVWPAWAPLGLACALRTD